MIKKWKSLLVLICLIWTTFGIGTFMLAGHQYIGNSYFDSENFYGESDDFFTNLGPIILNAPKASDLKNKLDVTQTEIDEHRNYYGTLGEQINSIRAQYGLTHSGSYQCKCTRTAKKIRG